MDQQITFRFANNQPAGTLRGLPTCGSTAVDGPSIATCELRADREQRHLHQPDLPVHQAGDRQPRIYSDVQAGARRPGRRASAAELGRVQRRPRCQPVARIDAGARTVCGAPGRGRRGVAPWGGRSGRGGRNRRRTRAQDAIIDADDGTEFSPPTSHPAGREGDVDLRQPGHGAQPRRTGRQPDAWTFRPTITPTIHRSSARLPGRDLHFHCEAHSGMEGTVSSAPAPRP